WDTTVEWQEARLAVTCCGRRRSGLRCSPVRHGSTCSALAAPPPRSSIRGPSIATRWLRSARWCSGCGAHGVQARHQCRSCWPLRSAANEACRRHILKPSGPSHLKSWIQCPELDARIGGCELPTRFGVMFVALFLPCHGLLGEGFAVAD